MARGFIRGVLSGAGVSLCSVVLVSLLNRAPDVSAFSATHDPDAPRPGQVAQPADRVVPDAPAALSLADADAAAPQPDTLAALLAETMAPAAVPQAGGATELPPAQDLPVGALDGMVAPASDAPRTRNAPSGPLAAPTTEPGLSISTEPAQPRAPEPVPQRSAFAEPEAPVAEAPSQEPVADGAAPEIATEVTALAAPVVTPEAMVLPSGAAPARVARDLGGAVDPVAQDASDPVVGVPDKAASTQMAALAPQDAQPGPQPEVAVDAPAQPLPRSLASDPVPPIAAKDDVPDPAQAADLSAPGVVSQTTPAGESASARVEAKTSVAVPAAGQTPAEGAKLVLSQTITPVPDLSGAPALLPVASEEIRLASGVAEPAPAPVPAGEPAPAPRAEEAVAPAVVRVNRLPTLGTEPQAEAPQTEPEPEAAVEQPEPALAAPAPAQEGDTPFDRYAATFDAPRDKPLMAVILMDDGIDLAASATGLTALRALPYPVSFAVDALLPDAADRMSAYRAAGFEVLATIDLPEGAQAPDAEVNLSVALQALREVVGVLEGVGTGVQTTPDAGRQVAQSLARSGHGFVTQNRGLNTVQKLAAREGVPSGVIFRDFDAKEQSSTVIRRFLDQAAFRAGQEGAVIMLGRLREETLSALVLWTLQDRAGSVTMAPVSAVLRSAPL